MYNRIANYIPLSLLFLLFLLFVAGCPFLTAADTNLLAVGDWSKPARNDILTWSVRGRILLAQGQPLTFTRELPETMVYVELQNFSLSTIQIYYDPLRQLEGELRDAHGKLIPFNSGGGGGGPIPVLL